MRKDGRRDGRGGREINGRVARKPVGAETIEIGEHGSDTGIYDEDGRFSVSRFRKLFVRHDADGDGALDASELTRLFAGNRTDLIGHLVSRAEFSYLLELAGETRNGRRVVAREILERFYRGSFLYDLATEVRARRLGAGPMSRDSYARKRSLSEPEGRDPGISIDAARPQSPDPGAKGLNALDRDRAASVADEGGASAAAFESQEVPARRVSR
jgi:hypothetical protein